MNKAEIEKTKKGLLVDFNGHENLLVSFGGIQQGLGMPVFEFFNSISDIPCDKIYFRDFNQAWYQKGVDSELNHINKIIKYLEKKINSNKYSRICFIGNSMGGYASILFGSILNVDTVIAFAPQTFINRVNRILNFDKRWCKQINQVYYYKDNRKEFYDLKKYLNRNNSYKTQINVYYSPNHRLDKKHAERLSTHSNVVLHPIDEGGHSVVKVVRNNGNLKSAIISAFE
ncbi:hypothetical protein [Winogradskyella helgolandensis]|uniref:hypothetical protein n=1 Tax=Winogradskyella helgolandensis TaxID=2697010 RepID=UPI0015CBC353|nr:hypothetical protein [Winogradskyella helgolandensis]